MKREYEIGRVVESLAGRDRGRRYVICGRLTETQVWVTDGRTHPVSRPKKKNIKHLATKGIFCDTIKVDFAANDTFDAQIRRFLKQSDDFHKEEE